MAHYRYLIVGGGMTAAAAVKGIREVDEQGSIGMISQDKYGPYDRPPLTKGLWNGKPIEEIWRNVDLPGVELILNRKAVRLDPQAKQVTDETGTAHTYAKLLLATGGSPRRLPFDEGQIVYFRTLDDYKNLRSEAERGLNFGVIGGGFIGSEIAAALRMTGAEATMIFPENGISGLAFPADLSQFVTDYYRAKGVNVMAGEMVEGISRRGDQQEISTKGGKRLLVDRLVAGVGIHPNTELAEKAGLKIENGVIVDRHLLTNQPDIYAAGDVANFYNPLLDKRLRVEHEDNANTMGLMAGRNMAMDQPEEYNHLPFFYSDLFELGYEAVGELNASLEVLPDWTEKPFKKGVVYYLKDDRVRGVLLWNVWDKVDEARKLIGSAGPVDQKDLKGRIT
jgi:3-phenylpropionate/trans-cinnamate dioxygenase ferredoxin reductase component